MNHLQERTGTVLTAAVAGAATAAVIAVESSLKGEDFLFVYVCLIGVVWGSARLAARWTEPTEAPAGQWTDPYLLSYLASGPEHAVQTATIALVDRGLLRAQGDQLAPGVPYAENLAERPIERAILQSVPEVQPAQQVFQSSAIQNACDQIRTRLLDAHLLRRPERGTHRLVRAAIAAGAFLVTALERYVLGSARGMHRFGSLFQFATLAIALVLLVEGGAFLRFLAWSKPPSSSQARTRAGDALLTDMRQLFWTLPQRASQLVPGGATNELSFLVGLFGSNAAPAFARPTLDAWPLPPPPITSSEGSYNHTSSSSCSSSTSCSSSSCGGGGSGCGGCGGD